eukprot:jgi/Ulvmu1/1157/UM107_0031.1
MGHILMWRGLGIAGGWYTWNGTRGTLEHDAVERRSMTLVTRQEHDAVERRSMTLVTRQEHDTVERRSMTLVGSAKGTNPVSALQISGSLANGGCTCIGCRLCRVTVPVVVSGFMPMCRVTVLLEIACFVQFFLPSVLLGL